MRKPFILKYLAVNLFALIFSIFFSSARAYAVNITEYSLNISPARFDLILSPGQKYEGGFTVKNTSTEPITFSPIYSSYHVTSGTYDTDIVTRTAYNEIADWISFASTDYTVAPDEEVRVKFTINVPSNAHGGSQYATIGIHSMTGAGNGVIQSGHEITLLLHADVAGSITPQGSVLGIKLSSFFTGAPIAATVSLENTGNITLESSATIRVVRAISRSEVYTNADNPIVYSILPDTSREYEVPWTDPKKIGFYNVTIAVSYAETITTFSKIIFICPVWLIIVFFASVTGIVNYIIYRRRHLESIKSHGFRFKN